MRLFNARLAPDVYLGVVPILRGGEVVDWAVHMRRLPDDVRADVMLGEGRLTPEHLDDVAERLAAFHDGASLAPDRFGGAASVRANVEENFAQTRNALASLLRPDEVAELLGWQTSFVQTRWSLFEQRVEAGRVRDGHGDLRLEHVYFTSPSAPQAPEHSLRSLEPLRYAPRLSIIDCIEFNDRFRYADVCADVAFLSMDLASHGRVDLAERFVARYARASNDFDLYALIDFYESYRAFVRAKVATFSHARAEARRHLLLALSADRHALLSPSLVAVGGVIASGKSTLAERLGDAMSAPVLDADRTRKSMLGVTPMTRLREGAWHGAYDPTFTEKVYAEVLRRADVVLASGRPVVIDASFRTQAFRQRAQALAKSHGVPFRFVECRAPRDVCLTRLAARERSPSVSDGRRAIFDDFCKSYEAPSELPARELITIDTTLPAEENVARLRTLLDCWPKGLVA